VILPSNYFGVIVCLIVSMLCWGSWANLQKKSGKWRYELFYWDFSIGIALVAIVAAFTLGSLNTSDLTFQDNLLIATYHKISYALEGGFLIGLANLFLVAALSVAPIAVVFPIAMGLALVVHAGWLVFPPQGSVLLLSGGAVLVLIAVVVNAYAYSTYVLEQREVKKPLTPDPRTVAVKPPTAAKGVVLSVMSGLAMGFVSPLADISRSGEDGLGAYTAGLLFALTALGSTFVAAPFFFTFSVHGAPVQFRAYFKGARKLHLYGILAGVIWGVGLITAFASGGSLSRIQASPVAVRGFAEGAVIVASLWGLLRWREFSGSSDRVRILLMAMLVVWVIGAGLVIAAPGLTK
jgi:glucose uptake protein